MNPAPISPLCLIHEHLDEREASRVQKMLGRIRWGLVPIPQQPLLEDDSVLRHCPYMKANGPSSLCKDQCHLHHLIFAENWP